MKSGSRNNMVTSNFRPEVEIWPYRACAMKNMQPLFNGREAEISIGTVRSLWTWLWGRYHFPQNVFLVHSFIYSDFRSPYKENKLLHNQLENVAIANALQLEVDRATPALSRFIYDAMLSLKWLYLSIALPLMHYFTL